MRPANLSRSEPIVVRNLSSEHYVAWFVVMRSNRIDPNRLKSFLFNHVGMLELIVLKNRHSGQRPPFVAKAVWVRGLYREWSGNSYSDRTRIPRGVAAAFDPPGTPPSRLPFRD